MKKAITAIVLLILLVMIYTNVMSAFNSVSSMLNGLTSNPFEDSGRLINDNSEQMGSIPPSDHSSGEKPNSTEGKDIPGSGVYNITQMNETEIKKLLDPTNWYVGNTSLSSHYAYRMYNDTLKVVKNSTETSKSIIERFLSIFRIGSNNETQSGLEKLLNNTVGRVQNITKSTEDYISSLLGNDH